MIIVNGLLGFIAAPFVILAIGIWMCWLLIKVVFIGLVALTVFIIGLVRAFADQRHRARAL
jgi:hypothetical protein